MCTNTYLGPIIATSEHGGMYPSTRTTNKIRLSCIIINRKLTKSHADPYMVIQTTSQLQMILDFTSEAVLDTGVMDT